ncbi:MAG TPA: SWIM zinc finger family protein [Azospira sp.]|nr:SWIM zinc finger family protein [Azospira sp.]
MPAISLDEDATLVAEFPDGVVTRWPAGKLLAQAHCSCPATGICRHRLIAALQFRAEAGAAGAPSAGPSAPPVSPVSPGAASDTALATLLAASVLARAVKERDAGLTVLVRRRAAGEPCDTARLPAATVRFWAGAAIEAARCDCIQQAACEHVALGVWAFRQADAESPAAAGVDVHFGAPATDVRLDPGPYFDYLCALLDHGVVGGPAGNAQPLSLARVAAADAGAEWIVAVLTDLEDWSAAWAARSVRYAAENGVDRLTELFLRLELGAAPARAREVLGIGQPHEVTLDRLRLVCLGARTERDGHMRRTRLVLADLDTGTPMVLAHDWHVLPPADSPVAANPEESARHEAQRRASERVAPGVKLDALLTGQLLSQKARRFADGRIALARARSSQNSLLPQSGDWDVLTPPVRYTRVADLVRTRPRHPLVQARQAAGSFIVFSPVEITDALYDPQLQTVQCAALDPDGNSVLISRRHAAHPRQALEQFVAAIDGRQGRCRHIGGLLSWQGELPTLEPWSLVCDHVLSLDSTATASGCADALAALPLGRARAAESDPLAVALNEIKNLLAALLHHGLRALPPSWLADSRAAVTRLRHLGWPALAAALTALVDTLLEPQAPDHPRRLAREFSSLLILRQLHEDALAQVE